MATDITDNAITTDSRNNRDAISDQNPWRMFGTGDDAKGQPTQTNSISHGSPLKLLLSLGLRRLL